MKDAALFAQLLGLEEPWKVTSVEPDLENKSLSIHIDWPEGAKGPCPECKDMCPVYDHREEREWRHLDTMQFKTLLIAEVPRVRTNSRSAGMGYSKISVRSRGPLISNATFICPMMYFIASSTTSNKLPLSILSSIIIEGVLNRPTCTLCNRFSLEKRIIAAFVGLSSRISRNFSNTEIAGPSTLKRPEARTLWMKYATLSKFKSLILALG